MNVNQQWWDEFWRERSFDLSLSNLETESWVNLVWKVGLEEIDTLFKQFAPGKRMLECGCGKATVSHYMKMRGYDCVMLDYSKQAINLAKLSLARNSLKGEFVLGDMYKLPFIDNQFDLVYSGGVLEFFADITNPLREIVRVLKPGGLFVINIVPNKFSCQTLADIERTLAHSLKSFFTFRWREVLVWLKHLPPGVSHMSLKSYIAAFKSAGLENVSGHCVTPFPSLSLGRIGERVYVRLVKRLLPQWKRFNHSRSRWSEIWGVAYTIHGVKTNA